MTLKPTCMLSCEERRTFDSASAIVRSCRWVRPCLRSEGARRSQRCVCQGFGKIPHNEKIHSNGSLIMKEKIPQNYITEGEKFVEKSEPPEKFECLSFGDIRRSRQDSVSSLCPPTMTLIHSGHECLTTSALDLHVRSKMNQRFSTERSSVHFERRASNHQN